MKKKVFSLMMTLLLAFMGVAKADVVTIGEGTGTTYYCPFNSLYGYSFVEEVYTAAEVGMAGNITSISFDLSQSYSSEQTNNVVLYMKNVSRTNFSSNSDWETVTAGDIVYQGTWTIPANYTGWMTITLDTPFAYDGTSNLMIAMHESTSGYSTRYVHYTSTSNAVFTAHSDSANPDPYNLGSYSGTKSTNANRANIQLDITAAGGGGETVEVTIGDPTSTTTNSYLPTYSLYNYSFTQQIYTADEIGVGGTINSLTMWLQNTSSYARNLEVYMKEVTESTFSSGTAWVSMTASDMVGTFTLANGISSPVETTVSLSTPFSYTGSGNLVICVRDITGSWSSGAAGVVMTANGNQAIYNYRDSSTYDPTTPGVTGTLLTTKNVVRLSITTAGGGAGFEDHLHVKYVNAEGEEVIDSLNLGVRPVNAWMEPFEFVMYSDGPTYNVTVLDFTPSDGMFTVEGEELPFQVVRDNDVDLVMATNATVAGLVERQFVAITEGDRAAHIWPVTVEMYDPAIPDVWEKACTHATTFPFVEVPARAHNTTLHNDYDLPFDEIEEGYDAVYKLEFANDMVLNAEVTQGENGKVALYTEDFYGEGGPMATNNYNGPLSGAGGASAAPFEAQIGEGTSTTGYFPFYTLYNYTISENLFLATELAEASVTTAPMTSLSWYATNAPGYAQQGITIWMANVEDAALTTTSHIVTNMTKVYTGAMTPAIGWNEFVFNEGTFSWDGHSNVLIFCQRNNGTWNSTVNWQATTSLPFNAMAYRYQDSGAYDPTVANTMSTSTTRPNIIMKAEGRRNRDLVDFEDGTMPAGWQASSIGAGWEVATSSDYGSIYPYNGNYAIYSNGDGNYDYDYFVSPAVTINGAGSLSFAWCTPTWSGDQNDLSVGYGTTANGPWTWLMDSQMSNSWTTANYDLSSLNGTYYICFRSYDGYGYCTAIDDININVPTTPAPVPTDEISYGPVITNAPVAAGTYYLVASSTDEDFEVTINAQAMPCPTVDGFAFNPMPADNEDEIEPASVTLQWMNPANATEYQVVFGSTYYPQPGHPQTVISDWTPVNGATGSFTVRNLWNNTNYFWYVVFRNGGACEEGVESPHWGFTTHLNIPQNLTAVDETVFNDETITLNWTAVVDRTYRMYNVYRDGELIGHTTVNNISNTTYTDGPLEYNMEGYTYYVTAVYDEGESAPSNTVNVKVSGYGDVNGHVYEQDGTTGIAGATVTMVGQDEFGVSHTYNFQTNTQGYYTGHIYAGAAYDGQAAKDGYQTATAPVQGEPIVIDYDETTSPIDYILDENFDPVCTVIAEYYPDSLDPNSPYVKVYWGCGLPGEEIIEPFETGDFSAFDWQIDPTYPWSITTNNPYEGTYCMKSGGAGVANVVSNMTVTVNIPADGLMSFYGKISCESSWDYGYFYIDGVQKGQYTGAGNWAERTFDVTAGDHTFQWRYTKDGSVNSNDDCFYVDYITFYQRPEPPIPGMTYDFENSTMQGWTSVDADGDGYGWMVGSEKLGSTGNGHNGSLDLVLSQSYDNSYGVLYPDNYLVSPQVQLGGIVRFYACAQDAGYAAEHFGVAVSTTNTQPSSFTMVQEWTMSAKSAGETNGKPVKGQRSGRAQGNWYEYTVDLSAYSGMGYVAIRHFNCSDMFYLDVDDITIGEPGKGIAETRSLNHYRVYRTNCYQECPFTEDNTVLLATVWVPDTVYMDVEWADLPAGVYKWGVGAVYEGNRGEMIEAPINWAEPVTITRDATADNDPNPVMGEEGNRAPWDLMTSFSCTSGYQYGVATDGNYIYTCSWSASSTSQFYKYDMNGNFVEEFNVSGSGQIRDLTYDGQYFYGVANSTTVYCLDLANHALVSTFTSGFGAAQRGITYDPQRDGFWVIGNWSGNLTLINRSGAVQFTGPAPTSASGLAYYKDDDNVEHIYCFNNGDNGVYDYNITTNTMGGSVFNFSSTPGYDSGSSGGCHIAQYGDKMAFIGDLQQSPNLIGIYELKDASVGPTPAGDVCNQLALPRESETIWSNCLDKDMYLDHVSVNVLLNSADSPEGTEVTLTNYNEYEQQTYGGYEVTLDGSGYYLWENFRKGEYAVKVEHVGYEPITDSVSIWSTTDLRYVLTEIIYGVENVYVSRTGWAMWDPLDPQQGGSGVNPGGGGGTATTFNVGFEDGLPEGWVVNDANHDGYTWELTSDIPTAWPYYASLTLDWYRTGTNAICSGSYINGVGAITPDDYLVTPQVNLVNGSTFSFWAAATDASYPAEHFGVFVSDDANTWTSVQEWTLTAKSSSKAGDLRASRDGNGNRLGNWHQYSVDLSAYAGQKYIAIRHFNCNDQYIMCVDDIELTAGREGDRHLEYYKVMCTSIDGVPIFNHNTVWPFCQLSTDEPYNAPLVEGEHYLCKVAVMYSTGMSAWSEPVEWEYEPCDHWGPVDEVEVNVNGQGNHIEWVFEHGFNPYGGDTPGPGPQPGENATVILTCGDVWGDGSGYQMLLDADATAFGTTIPETGALSTACSGNEAIYAEFEYKIPTNADGNCSTQNMVMNNSVTIEIPAGVYDWCITNPTPGDRIWIASAQGNVGGRQNDYTFEAGRTYEFTVTLQGSNDAVNVTVTGGAKGNFAPLAAGEVKDIANVTPGNYGYIVRPAYSTSNMIGQNFTMVSETSLMFNIGDIANYDERVYFLYKLMNDSRFSVINGEQVGMFVVNGNENLNANFVDFIAQNISEFTNMDKYQAADMANAYKGEMPSSIVNAMMTDLYIQSRENNTCGGALPFCTDNGMYEFPAGVNAGSGEPGPDYDCLYTTPNPAWYYMRIGDPGAIDIYMYSTPSVDIDFCCWGPFDDPESPCPNGLTEDKVVSCSYSAAPTEHCMIPATAQTGEYYILVITNYSNQTCNINFSAVAGAGSTDCGILPPVDIIGFLITMDGEYLAFAGPTDREYTHEGEFGDHEYCVRPIYPGEMTLPDHNYGWSMGCPVCNTPGGQVVCDMPYDIHSELVDANHVKVWWGTEPAIPVSEWLYYDDGTYATSVGAGGTLYWGTMFPAASLAPYAGTSLTKVAVHTSYACSATLNVYVGGAQPGGSPAATQNFTMAGDQEFMEITLNNPVAVDGTQNLWITFYQSGETYPADACTDTGDANNRWVSVDGASWLDLASAGLPGYGWMIRGFVTNQAKGGEIVSLPEFKGNVGGELSHSAVVSKPADLSFMNRAELVKYNVYRSTEAAGTYTLIGEVAETGADYYEYIDSPTAAGTYYYQVRAEYSNDCESDPAVAADDPTHDYVSETTTAESVGENDDNVALYPNPTNGNVTIEAAGMSRITVVSVLGQVVFDTELDADHYTLNMAQFNAGMYMVRVYTENGVTVKRVTVMQ